MCKIQKLLIYSQSCVSITVVNFRMFSLLPGDLPGGSDSKASVYNAEELGLNPGLGRSSGEGNGNPLQYYCLENPMDRGA